MRLILKIFLTATSLLVLPGCETLSKAFNDEDSKIEEYSDYTAQRFYQEAKSAMDSGDYPKAIELYEALESRYPFGEYAAQTQLDLAYAYFKNEDSESAVAAADRFIKLNPRHPNVDYAYYLKGLAKYNSNITFINRFIPTDSSQRDQNIFKAAYDSFDELVRLFPHSKYVPDAKQRMIALRNNMAMYEIHVARYYMKREAYLAAANRAATVVKNYQRTPAVPEALQIMEEAYTKLKLDDLAADTKRIYAQNYPNGASPSTPENTTLIEDVWDVIGFEE